MSEIDIDELNYIEEELEDDFDEEFDEEVVIIRKKKRGRPKSKTARNKMVTLRMSTQEADAMMDMADRYNVSRSHLVRKALVVYDHIMSRNR